jgi:Fe-S cluster biogenesis protein NfuA
MDEIKKQSVIKRINDALEKIRPYLVNDGGDIQLEELTDDMKVKVRLIGACDHCPFSIYTMKAGVEATIIQEVPEITGVEAM